MHFDPGVNRSKVNVTRYENRHGRTVASDLCRYSVYIGLYAAVIPAAVTIVFVFCIIATIIGENKDIYCSDRAGRTGLPYMRLDDLPHISRCWFLDAARYRVPAAA